MHFVKLRTCCICFQRPSSTSLSGALVPTSKSLSELATALATYHISQTYQRSHRYQVCFPMFHQLLGRHHRIQEQCQRNFGPLDTELRAMLAIHSHLTVPSKLAADTVEINVLFRNLIADVRVRSAEEDGVFWVLLGVLLTRSSS